VLATLALLVPLTWILALVFRLRYDPQAKLA